MSDYNPLITDRETRDLLNKLLLEQDDSLIENLIEMESKIMYAHEPLVIPAVAEGHQIISKLNHKFAGKILMKWVFATLTIVSVVTTFLVVKSYDPPAAITPAPEINTPKEPDPQVAMAPPVVEDSTRKNKVAPAQKIPFDTAAPALPVAPEAPAAPPEKPQAPAINTEQSFTITKETPGRKKESSATVDTIFKGIRNVEVNGQFCDVHVRAIGSDEVRVKGSVHVTVKGIVLKRIDYTIQCERENDVLKIKVVSEGGPGQVMVGSISSEGTLDIELPAATNVLLKNASGDISVKGLNGKQCEVQSNFGDIHAEDIQTNIKLKSSSGNITLLKVKGNVDAYSLYGDQSFNGITGNLQTFSSSGNLHLGSIAGDVSIEARYGDINMKRISGNVTVKSASGDVTVTDASGKQCTVKSSYGNIDLTNITADVKISSKSGNVELEQVSGDLDISATYGNISMNTCKGNVAVQVSSGNVIGKNVTITDSAAFKSTYGDVRMNLTNNISDLSFDLQSVSGNIRVLTDGKNAVPSDNDKYYQQRGRVWVKAYTASGNQTFD